MPSTCPACNQPANGRFCSSCGANLVEPTTCAECGNELPVGGRYCNQCGAATPTTREALARGEAGRPNTALPWAIGAAAVAVALLAAVLLTRGPGTDATASAAPFAGEAAPAAGDARAVDLSSMTPREAADRLYDRVMRLVESGDSAQARTFLPMALAAYDRLPELDIDARYHLGVLYLYNGDARAALAQADTILAADADHLFGLYNAAKAQQALGDQARARELFQRFLDVYDAQTARELPEYRDHEPALTVMRQDASRAVDSL